MGKENDITNIEFKPETQAQRIKFLDEYILKDLRTLQLTRLGTFEEKRSRLMEVLVVMEKRKELESSMTAGEYAGAMIMIKQAIPCVLHCENRVGEKIIKTLLIDGYNAKDPDSTAQKQLIIDFKNKVNLNILSDGGRRSCWSMHTEKSNDAKKVIADQTMSNWNVRMFIKKLIC